MMWNYKNSKLSDFVQRWILLNAKSEMTMSERFLNNEDLYPVKKRFRLWDSWNYVAFWLADAINVNTWMIAGTAVTSGLAWWEAWITVWVGYTLSALILAAVGRAGSVYHISFPVLSRSSFGIWGSFWPILNRAVMACIWYGVQAWIGGECVTLMIRSIWPSFSHIPDTMSKSGTKTYQWLGFFIFWLISNVAIWFPVHQLRHLFTVKSFLAPPAAIAFLIWALVKAHGAGDAIHSPTTLNRWDHGWAVVSGIVSCLNNFATLIVNNPDFTRFATTPNAPLWPQIITIPVGFGITTLIGVLVGSASKSIYGENIWNPLDLLSNFLNHSNAHGVRAGVFFIATGLCLAQLGTNIAANTVSAGNDLSALFPAVINIRRGAYIASIVGIAMCPWNLLSSSNSFSSSLSAYAVFLSSFAGVMLADYYVVRKGYLKVGSLYTTDDKGPYWFFHGISFRGFISYICGLVINVTGLAGSVGDKVPQAAMTMSKLAYLIGILVSFIAHVIICTVFPVTECGSKYMDEHFEETDHYLLQMETPTDIEETEGVPLSTFDTEKFDSKLKADHVHSSELKV
ncbi:purine transporter [Schizosaccharomyces cryophilus OY26]|uniref:Purine transporter n=1 Tax=Schizosaccharomyces cryophilus (strain OY26 / ATCC MYA-4695 / CBS 11777 / NBRC 106824 / NRRL Y48691) TaxID=653667 RepID=S9W7C4_SCHCR|nr:purine transporter [Schizosaccharomyces cryophilus OY26]EPY53805.1 purine transporter [Schizosaccharomyces cryophilus OY26]